MIKINYFDKNVTNKIINRKSFLNNLKLNVYHQSVAYNELKSTYIIDSKVWKEKKIPKGLEIIFTKDSKYSNDEEYRIAFIFEYNGEIMPVIDAPIIISIKDLRGVIE